jgi:hypothetical protein
MVGSDLAMALAYFSLPFIITRHARLRPQLNLGRLATLFAVFIFACGITHVLDVWTSGVPTTNCRRWARPSPRWPPC